MTLKFCSLSSGSSGNCQYVATEHISMLIDAGFSGKRVEELLKSIEIKPTEIDCILVTHEHTDHIKGVGVLSRRYNIPIYANENTWLGMEGAIGEIKEENIKVFKTGEDFELDNLGILPFNISHDAKEPVGFCIFYKNTKISIITDTGWVSNNMMNTIKGSSLILIESNHDVEMLKVGRYPWYLKKRILSEKGHLSNDDAGNVLKDIICEGGEKILLGHLSKENNFPQLAYQTVANIINDAGIDIHNDITLSLTHRDKATKIYEF